MTHNATMDMIARLHSFVQRYAKIMKYLISGGSAAVVNLSVLYIVTERFHVWYLASSFVANIAAFFVSFFLQKFWTFGNASVDRIKKQLFFYFVVALFNLGANTMFMYVFVEYGGLHYIVAQICTSALIAIESFFVYQHLIFHSKITNNSTS